MQVADGEVRFSAGKDGNAWTAIGGPLDLSMLSDENATGFGECTPVAVAKRPQAIWIPTKPFSGNLAMHGKLSVARSSFTLIKPLVVILIIALPIGILLSVLSSARASARTIKCSAQLRGIGIAMQAYADDWQESPSNGRNPLPPGETQSRYRWPSVLGVYFGRENEVTAALNYTFKH